MYHFLLKDDIMIMEVINRERFRELGCSLLESVKEIPSPQNPVDNSPCLRYSLSHRE